MERKVALVTGASRGIGRAIAIGLAKEGILVAINYRSRDDAAEEVAREIAQIGGHAIVLKADVSKEDEVRSMVDKIKNTWGVLIFLLIMLPFTGEEGFKTSLRRIGALLSILS